MSLLDLLPLWAKLAILAAIAAAAAAAGAWCIHYERDIGRAEVQAAWNAATLAQQAADLRQSQANAAETARRLAQQQENQRVQDKELAAARAAADRNARDAERVRVQSATAADLWSHTLRNSPTQSELAAAADAIRVLTDVRGRADQRASFLATYADTARAAGLKCERDYDALTLDRAWPR